MEVNILTYIAIALFILVLLSTYHYVKTTVSQND